jgi:hypothetical protein
MASLILSVTFVVFFSAACALRSCISAAWFFGWVATRACAVRVCYWIVPLGIERAVTIDVRTRTVSAERQEKITCDSVTVKLNAVLAPPQCRDHRRLYRPIMAPISIVWPGPLRRQVDGAGAHRDRGLWLRRPVHRAGAAAHAG